MPYHFIITKALPAVAILFIYWLGSFDLPTVIFLPTALIVAFSVFSLTRKYGEKQLQEKEKDKQNKN